MKQKYIGFSKYCNNEYWPPVESTTSISSVIKELMNENSANIISKLKSISTVENYDENLMDALGEIYSLFFHYKDSPIYNEKTIDVPNIFRIKILLEDEMKRKIISPVLPNSEDIYNSVDLCCDFLEDLTNHNKGLNHSFFDYTESKMTKNEWVEFLLLETIRNEVVDDEVAMMIPGLQHSMKQVMSSNLWDECGNGNIDNFHTTWLRRLLKSLNKDNDIIEYRKTKPWFASITSNSLNSLLTTVGDVYRAYGHFLITESWVAPHFTKMLIGMENIGLTSKDTQIYFTAHKTIDPFHTAEMISGIRKMKPQLEKKELKEIVSGACQAVAAGSVMYDKLEKYFNEGAL